MDIEFALGFAIFLVGATSFWAFLTLKKRIELLEHEVRWLRAEFSEYKPFKSPPDT